MTVKVQMQLQKIWEFLINQKPLPHDLCEGIERASSLIKWQNDQIKSAAKLIEMYGSNKSLLVWDRAACNGWLKDYNTKDVGYDEEESSGSVKDE